MKDFRILITSVGGFYGSKNIELMKQSIPGKIWVLGVDKERQKLAEVLSDKFIKVPDGKSKLYVESIIKIIKKENINYILPCSDEEVIALLDYREKIENLGAKLLCAHKIAIQIMRDKIKTYNFLKKNKIFAPRFEVVNNVRELSEISAKYFKKYSSFVLKNPISRGNRGIFIVNKYKTKSGLSREFRIGYKTFKLMIKEKKFNFFPLLIMEKLGVPAYDIDILAKNGKVIYAIPRERLNPEGVPFLGNIIRKDKQLIKLATKVVKKLNLSYLYDLDVMTRKDGTPVICEINPRPSGSISAAICCGVPLYRDLLLLSDIDNFKTNNFFPKNGLKILPKMDCHVF